MKTSRTCILALVSTLVLSFSSYAATSNGEFDRTCIASGGTPSKDAFGNLWCDYPDGDAIVCAPDLSDCEVFVIESRNRMDDGGGVIVQMNSLNLMKQFITPLIVEDLIKK